MTFTLTDLTTMTRKCCSRPEGATSTTSRYQFEMDFVKLENMLKQKKTNLHVIGLDKVVLSRPIDIAKDAQFISEYIKNKSILDASLTEGAEIIQFMLFSTENEKGTMRPKYIDEEGNAVDISDKELFTMCNEPDQINENLIKCIVTEHPVYRIIVVRLFNEKNDRYDYNVNIRSNYQMISYMKNLANGTVAEAEPKQEEAVAETTEEVAEPAVEESAEVAPEETTEA